MDSQQPGAAQSEARPLCAVFFDIDGTLISTHGAGRQAFVECLWRVFGIRDRLEDMEFAGGTDRKLLDTIMRRHHLSADRQREEAFFRCLPRVLAELLAERPASPLPGVRRLLAQLRGDPRFVVALLTGNTAECARVKLASAGLDRHFELGAFGREHADRRQIAERAIQELRFHLGGYTPPVVWVVGDTVYDVEAAKAVAARCLAVASGKYGVEALREAGADLVVKNLENVSAADLVGHAA